MKPVFETSQKHLWGFFISQQNVQLSHISIFIQPSRVSLATSSLCKGMDYLWNYERSPDRDLSLRCEAGLRPLTDEGFSGTLVSGCSPDTFHPPQAFNLDPLRKNLPQKTLSMVVPFLTDSEMKGWSLFSFFFLLSFLFLSYALFPPNHTSVSQHKEGSLHWRLKWRSRKSKPLGDVAISPENIEVYQMLYLCVGLGSLSS